MTARLAAYLLLCRPQNMAITAVSVVLAGVLARAWPPPSRLYVAALAAALITGAANALNDYFDRDIDRVNKSYRPIPSGKVRPGAAEAVAIVLFALGLAASALPGPATLAIAAVAVVLLVFYSYRFKRRPVYGNLIVAALGATAFLYGGVAVGRPGGAAVPSLFALLYHFGREITKDMEDVSADRTVGAATIPIRFGPRAASLAARTSFLILILSTPLPFILDLYGPFYLAAVIVTVDLPLVAVIRGIGPDAPPAALARWNRLLKIGMVMGLVALFLGRF